MTTLRSRALEAAPLVAFMTLLSLSACTDSGPGSPLTDEKYPAKGQSIAVNPPLAEILETGQRIQLSADVRDALGKQVTGARVKWEALDPSVATVNQSGTVTGMSEGIAEIRGTYAGVSATAVVSVSRPKNDQQSGGSSVTLYPESETIPQVGGSAKLLAIARNPGGKLFGADKLSWSSTDASVVTVDSYGVVTGRKSGTARIIAQFNDAADTSEVVVAPSGVAASISVSPKADTIPSVGGTVTLVGRVLDGSGIVVAGADMGWTSLDPSIATVKLGVVQGVKKGVVKIVVLHKTFADTATIWVAPVSTATSLYVTPKTDTIPQIGGTVTLSATLLDGSGATLSQPVTWGTLDPLIGSVTQTGVVKGAKTGVVRITASYNSLLDTAKVWVAPPQPLYSVTTDPAMDTVAIGSSVPVKAIVKDTSGSVQEEAMPTWVSLDGGVATVSEGGPVRGVDVKGVASGKARIVATYGGAADTAVVQVGTSTTGGGGSGYTTQLKPDTVRLTVSGPEAMIDWFGYDSTGKEVDSTTPTWVSLNPAIASVPPGPSGHTYVKPVAAGITQVVATWNGMADTATVIVNSGSNGTTSGLSVTVSPSSTTITTVGGTVQLTVALKDSTGSSVPSSQATWSSLDPSQAGVSTTGFVTTYAPGTARIVASYATAADTSVIWTPTPGSAGNLTPPDLRLALGPLVDRNTAVPGWPSGYESKLDAAINRLVTEVAAGSYTAIPDVPDGDNPHYGPLRMVTMRNIRAGLPLNETEPGFKAALKITREWIRGYAIPNGNRIAFYRNTALIDAEIVYWIYRNDTGDNGLLARQAREYIQVASAWLSQSLTPATEDLSHPWMDTRPIALAIEAALAAQRVGWDFNDVGPGSYNPHGQRQFKPAGVSSWETWIDYVNGYIDRMQDQTMVRFGGMKDPNGYPIVFGNIRFGQSGGWSCSSTPCTNYVAPYPFKSFMDGMLASALLKAYRQHGSVGSLNNAIEMAAGIQQHYDAGRQALPYSSHGTSASKYFYYTSTDYVLNNFWVRPLIEMYSHTGQAWMRDIATGLLSQSLNTDWLWRFKQSQQLASATEPQSAQALLAGVR